MPELSPNEAKVTSAKHDVHATHPFNHAANHEKLLQYMKARLDFANQTRGQLTSRFESIDKDVAGYMVLSDDDLKRRQQQLAGKGPKMTDMNLPLVLLHLDDALTFFINVFAPESGMFQAAAGDAEKEAANAFVALMNANAQERGYFRELLKFVFDCLKYNLGGIRTEWTEQKGNIIVNDETRNPKSVQDVVWSGNDMKSVDMYNFLWDPSVHPIDLHEFGEYCFTVETATKFQMQRLAEKGDIFNADAVLANPSAGLEARYYTQPPVLFDMNSLNSSAEPGGTTNWVSVLSEGTFNTMGGSLEKITGYLHLNPTQFGLVPAADKGRDKLEIWRITLLNTNTIVEATHLNNSHGRLPFNFASPMEDNLGIAQKSVAEVLAPLQTFASFLINTHTASSRKNIWDFLVYDESIVDMSQVSKDDVAARIPVKPAGYGTDISKAIWQNHNILDTDSTMVQLEKVINLMQMLWPTNASPQGMMGLDRPVEAQVTQAVSQWNRRLQKAAKLIDEQALRPSRFMMHFNILQFQQAMDIISDTGQKVAIDPAKFRDSDFRFLIGEGLKSMDKVTLANQARQLLRDVLQSQQATQEIDILGLIDQVSNFMDFRLDIDQLRKTQPPTSPEGQANGPADTVSSLTEPTTRPPQT